MGPDETPIPKRTCRIRPKLDICTKCRDNYVMYHTYYNCQECDENNKRYELIHIGIDVSESEDFALVVIDGVIKKVPLSRVRDIKEE